MVNTKSMKIKNTAPLTGNLAICETPVIFSTTMQIGIFNTKVIRIPNTPLINPIMNVSALNTRVISFLLAPIDRKIPISFVRSNTEIYVMIPIMMLDTMSDTDTKAIKT